MMLPFHIGIMIALIAFVAEYVDSSLGMGYGTLLTPVLMLMGYSPKEVVPTVLLSELVTGALAGFTHHRAGNVDFKLKSTNIVFIIRKIRELGIPKSYAQGVSLDLKIALTLGVCSVVGTVAAVLIAVRLPPQWMAIYIGTLIAVIGAVILLTLNKTFRFSWRRLFALGLVASFNKGLSAGGYGPVVCSGQILTGVRIKSAVGITSLAEALTCLVGIIVYWIKSPHLTLAIAPYNVVGALLAVPCAALSVKIINEKRMKLAIGVLTLLLGIFTVTRFAIP